MATTSKKKPTKRQQANSELPLARSKKSTAKSKRPATTKKRSTKMVAAKSKAKKTTKATSAKKSGTKKITKPTTKKKTKAKSKAKNKQLNIWLGPHYKLQIQLKRTKSKKSRRRTKKQKIQIARRRKLTSAAFIILGISGFVYFSSILYKPKSPPAVYAPPVPVEIESANEPIGQAGLLPSKPTTLKIPDVDIETSLTSVGRTGEGAMEVPESYDIAGWYKHSPTPGELGPSVIAGHVDSYQGPAVFWRLSQLKRGQTITVEREDGTSVKFEVTDVKQFDQDNFPTQEVYGNINHAGLRLITCGGQFNYDTGRYSHNTVVYAKLAG